MLFNLAFQMKCKYWTWYHNTKNAYLIKLHRRRSRLSILPSKFAYVEEYRLFHFYRFVKSLFCNNSILIVTSHLIGYRHLIIFMLPLKKVVSIIQTYRPWTPRRTSGRIVHKKNWRESEAYRNFGKRFDWSLAIKRHIVMAAPIVETIWFVNGF